jgi:hypothetical protein
MIWGSGSWVLGLGFSVLDLFMSLRTRRGQDTDACVSLRARTRTHVKCARCSHDAHAVFVTKEWFRVYGLGTHEVKRSLSSLNTAASPSSVRRRMKMLLGRVGVRLNMAARCLRLDTGRSSCTEFPSEGTGCNGVRTFFAA